MPDDQDNVQLDRIAAVVAGEPLQNVPDDKTREEAEDLDRAQKEAELESFRQDIGARKQYANRIFILICAWLISMLVLLLLEGFRICGFNIADRVLITAITGTTLNVLGIFIIVANYLFPKKPPS